jgi:tRNA1Val (adenine37-N6)-methyltransferase
VKPFTYEYSQPSEYKFSLDSIEMPHRVSQRLAAEGYDFKAKSALDLCAGCGVIGLEFHFYHPELKKIDFVEVQDVYASYFLANIEKVKSGPKSESVTQFQFLNLNYDRLVGPEFSTKYDLVLCNPPYFEADQGRPSPNQFKNRCRFYIDSDFKTLISAILNVLKPGGLAFFLVRPLLEHKKDLLAVLKIQVISRAEIQVLDLIRGTSLVKLKRTV